MLDNTDANAPSRDDENLSVTAEYLRRAGAASDAGDALLSIHLYLAAFEEAAVESPVPSEDALNGLKQAWVIACAHKERSMAEYIYEKMEPYLTQDEVMLCMNQLQSLALDRLEEFGVSRQDLEEMTQMISQDLMGMMPGSGMPLGLTPKIVKVEHVVKHPLPSRKKPIAEDLIDQHDAGVLEEAAPDEPAPVDAAPAEAASADAAPVGVAPADAVPVETAPESQPAPFVLPEEVSQALAASAQSAFGAFAQAAQEAEGKGASEADQLRYDQLAGYDSTIRVMRDLGIGMQDDEEFKKLVETLNARHGLDRMPAADSLLFRSPAREDANRFIAATVGEIRMPALRMHMEENLQGMPMLCVTAQADSPVKAGGLRNAFEGGGILVLENLDTWPAPSLEPAEEAGNSLIAAQVSRGVREAVNLIRAAVENPEVHVLISASSHGVIDGFFLDMLEPLTLIDIDFPTPEERVDIWMDIAREHPSIRGVNRADLVRLSANMPRYDMYMAAREAIEEAYKLGMITRHYQPVTRDNIFDKLAAYQPLDSNEYHELEEAVIRDFRRDFDQFEAFILGNQSL